MIKSGSFLALTRFREQLSVELIQPYRSMPLPAFLWRSKFKWLLALLMAFVASVLLWGDRLLIATDVMPAHADAGVVMQGSFIGQKVRMAGAMRLLERGIVGRVLVSVPKESYWGESIPPVARTYLERTYGSSLATRVDFCETTAEVNSTRQEVLAAMDCIEEHQWRSIVVVTSDYHTRRAGVLWRRTTTKLDPKFPLAIEGVPDPEFQRPWWRHRQSAKIWLGESLKLAWTL